MGKFTALSVSAIALIEVGTHFRLEEVGFVAKFFFVVGKITEGGFVAHSLLKI